MYQLSTATVTPALYNFPFLQAVNQFFFSSISLALNLISTTMTLMKKVQLLFSVTAMVATNAQNLNQQCSTTQDCPEGTACIAGIDTAQSIQTCVKYPACGGDVAGNCPVLLNDQLTCSFVQDQSCSQSGGSATCKDFDGTSGIFKCLSLKSCNVLFGNNSCSGKWRKYSSLAGLLYLLTFSLLNI